MDRRHGRASGCAALGSCESGAPKSFIRRWSEPSSPPPDGPDEPIKVLARKLLNHLQIDVPQQLESLVETFESISSSELISALFELEMSGLVRQLPGKSFVKVW